MPFRRLGGLALAAALTATVPTVAVLAQSSATSDVKSAGSDTKNAAKEAGTGVKKGTKKVYHKTKHGTKKVLNKVSGKPDNATTNPSH